jgi:hypothetical protein
MDSVGYTGSVSIQLYKSFSPYELSYFSLIMGLTYTLAVVSTTLQFLALLYFLKKSKEPVPESSTS